MKESGTYRFEIDQYTPATIPMRRLAEYMSALAKFLGNAEYVHFNHVEPGSTVIVQKVESVAVEKVRERLSELNYGTATKAVRNAYKNIDDLLEEDNAVGHLTTEAGDGNIIYFPGRDRPKALEFGPITDDISVDGVLIRIGGKDKTVHATLQEDSHTWNGVVSRDLARELAPFLFSTPIRAFGNGQWYRTADGVWELRHFHISSYIILDNAGWFDTVQKLRAIEGSRWRELSDPHGKLASIRGNKDDTS